MWQSRLGWSGLVLLVALLAPAAARAEAGEDRIDAASLERRIEAARARLESAAREVAELTAGLMPLEPGDVSEHVGRRRAMLGVQLGAARQDGATVIASVSPGGPAAAAGVLPGDVIVSLNGRRVNGPDDVSHQVRELKPGTPARLDLERAGTVQHVVVATRPLDPRLLLLAGDGEGSLAASLEGVLDRFPMLQDGGIDLELAPLSAGLGRYFGTDRGVLVLRAPADGALPLRDGDVITAIDGREPQGVSHALRILRSYQPGERVSLAILRDHKAQKLDLTLPARAGHVGHRGPVPPPAAPAPPAAPGVPGRAAAPDPA